MKQWKIPVAWQMYGYIVVEGDTLVEAWEKAESVITDSPVLESDTVVGSLIVEDIREFGGPNYVNEDDYLFNP